MAGRVIAITGGIGSGKSVVASVVSSLGGPVYDCDSRARSLMENSMDIKERLVDNFGHEVIGHDGHINRPYLSQQVFGDPAKLKLLNGIVHGAVRDDFRNWCSGYSGTVWVETAILLESGMDKLVDAAWNVVAPVELRVRRVMARSGLEAEEVKARIIAQKSELHLDDKPVYTIQNDDVQPVLPMVLQLMTSL